MQEGDNNHDHRRGRSQRRRGEGSRRRRHEGHMESAANLAAREMEQRENRRNRAYPEDNGDFLGIEEENPDQNIRIQSGRYIYSSTMIDIGITSVVYTGLIMLLIVAMVIDKTDTSDIFSKGVNARWEILLIIQAVVAVTVSLLTLANIKRLETLQILTTVDIALYLTLVAIFYGLGIKYQWLLVAIFGTLGFVAAFYYLETTHFIFIYLMVPIPPLCLAIKADGTQQKVEWVFFLVPVIITAACGLMLCIAFIVLAVKRHNQFMIDILIHTFIWRALQSLGLFFTCGWVLFRALSSQDPFWLTLALALYHLLGIGIYLFKNKDDIALDGADAEPVEWLGEEERDIAFEKEVKESVFYRLAENWLSDDRKEAEKRADGKSVSEQNIGGELRKRDSVSGGNECTVCLTDRLAFMWMPCGHLTVCEGCAKYLMDNKKLECIICKAPCTSIYHISELAAVGAKVNSDFLFKVEQR